MKAFWLALLMLAHGVSAWCDSYYGNGCYGGYGGYGGYGYRSYYNRNDLTYTGFC